jgi:tetratricopeptide (TPR) repeat protein
MRRASNRMRVTAQLVDAANGAQLWSDTFDGVVDDVFDIQERIAENVVGRIAPQIRAAEMERSRRARPENLDAYDLTLRAARYFYVDAGGPAELMKALELAALAIQRDPTYGYGLHVAAWLDFNRMLLGFSKVEESDLRACEALARRSIAAARGDPEILCRGALILIHIAKDYDQNLALARSAVDDAPNNIDVLTEAAVVELHCGNVEEAIRLAKQAMALSPKDSVRGFPTATIAHANMILGDYEAAIEWASRSVALNPTFVPAYWMLVAGNAHMGRMGAAKEWHGRWLAIQPQANLSHIRRVQPAKDPLRLAAIYEGLALAGIPESTPTSP